MVAGAGNRPIMFHRLLPNRSRRRHPAKPETAQEAEGAAARRRSTVREKVSFLSTAQPEAPAPVAPQPA